MQAEESLEDLLEEMSTPGPEQPAPGRPRNGAPKGFEPGVRYMGGKPYEITTDAVVEEAPTEAEWLDIVEGMGIKMPEGWRLILVEAKYDPVAWTRDEPFWEDEDGKRRKMPALTRPAWRYRFRVVEESKHRTADDLLAAINGWKRAKPIKVTSDDAFTVVYADMQIGKWEAAGGTERTIRRVLALTDQAVAEYKRLAKLGVVGPVCLIFPGDGCEGFVSQNGRLIWRTDLAPSEMTRVYRRLLQHAVLEFAKVAPAVAVVAVAGNHDETTRQVATHHNDSWDVEAASAVMDGLAHDPERFGHITWHFAGKDKDVVTLDLAGTIVAVAHGHQFKGGAETWWAKQAHGCTPAGEAMLLISGHYHHLRVVQSGVKTWLQATALDNGSEWWVRETGQSAPSGLLTLVVGRGGWDRLRVLSWEGDACPPA